MGLIVRATETGRKITWFGRGMSAIRRFEDRHPVLRKLEFVPAAGMGISSFIDDYASLLMLTPTEMKVAAGILLTANIVFRKATFSALRSHFEIKKDPGILSEPSRERLIAEYSYALIVGRGEPERKIATEMLVKIGAPAVPGLGVYLWRDRPELVSVLGEIGEAAIPAFKKAWHGSKNMWDAKSQKLVPQKIGENMVKAIVKVLWRQQGPAAIQILEGWDGKWREVAEALGEIGDPAAIPTLAKLFLFSDQGWSISNAAMIALCKIDDAAAIPVLEAAFEKMLEEHSLGIIGTIAEARLRLGHFKNDEEEIRLKAYALLLKKKWQEVVALGPVALPVLEKALNINEPRGWWWDISDNSKNEIIKTLEEIGPAAIPVLEKALNAWSACTRKAVAEALLRMQAFKDDAGRERIMAYKLVADGKLKEVLSLGSVAVPALTSTLRDERTYSMIRNIEALGDINDPAAIPALAMVLARGDVRNEFVDEDRFGRFTRTEGPETGSAAARALGKIGHRDAVAYLLKALNYQNVYWKDVREALVKIADVEGGPVLERLLEHDELRKLPEIVRLIGKHRYVKAIPLLFEQLEGEDKAASELAAEVLFQINQFKDDSEMNRV